MAYTVDWISKVVTIPTSDLILVSGTRYQLNMWDFLLEIRRLESAFDGGLWAESIVDHGNTRVDFAGVDYAPFDEIINGYLITFTGAALRVDLVGSNNNLVDVFYAPGVSVVPSNSAGLIVYEGQDSLTELEFIRKLLDNKAVIAPDDLSVTIYDDDKVTPIRIYDVSADKKTRDPQ